MAQKNYASPKFDQEKVKSAKVKYLKFYVLLLHRFDTIHLLFLVSYTVPKTA